MRLFTPRVLSDGARAVLSLLSISKTKSLEHGDHRARPTHLSSNADCLDPVRSSAAGQPEVQGAVTEAAE